MTIRKKIFYSNTIMVFLALLILLVLGGILIVIFKDEFLKRINSGSVINTNISKVEAALYDPENADYTPEEWSTCLEAYGFRVYAAGEKGKKLYTNLRPSELEAVEEIKNNDFPEGRVEMYFMEGSTILGCEMSGAPVPFTLIAASSPDGTTFWGLDRGFFETFVIVFFVMGAVAIAGILLCSQFFTKRLIGQIMKPLDIINAATERISEGNLEEKIAYDKEDEFRPVCDSVNLMQQSLKESREKQKAYEKARTELVSGISHDLRTPLTSIKGYVKGMLDGIANTEEKQKHYLTTVYRKSCDMDRLLTKLFYFSKLETGGMPFFRQKVDIGRMVTEYAEEKRQEIIDRDAVLHIRNELQPEAGVYICDLDKDQTRRVFDNLVENSIKYAQTEKLVIGISVRKIGNQIRIRFMDNGVGVNEEQLPHVFEQFYRGDESRTSKNDGSGLGLYVCRYIISQQGGTIEAENGPGFPVDIQLPLMEGE